MKHSFLCGQPADEAHFTSSRRVECGPAGYPKPLANPHPGEVSRDGGWPPGVKG